MFDQYAYDGVHYTDDGARLLARLEVDAIFASIPEPSVGLGLLLLGIRALHRTRR